MVVTTRKRSAELASWELRRARKKPRTEPEVRLVGHGRSKAPPIPIFASDEQLFNQDIWTCIVGFLEANDLANLALASRFFLPIAMDDRVWKSLCMEQLRVVGDVSISPQLTWKRLYISAFERRHFYTNSRKHIIWKRMGFFNMPSTKALATGKLWEEKGNNAPVCFIPNVKPGIWIADFHLLGCPLCDQRGCQGTMQVVQARNWELFHCEDFVNGKEQYDQVGSYECREKLDTAAAGIFDCESILNKDALNNGVLNFKKWISDKYPRSCVSPLAAAATTPLDAGNTGVLVKFSVMRIGGPVMAIRISHELICDNV